MDRRGLLALGVCLVFIFVYYYVLLPRIVPSSTLGPAPKRVETSRPTTTASPAPAAEAGKSPPPAPTAPESPATPAETPKLAPPEKPVVLDVTTQLFHIQFTTQDAAVRSVELLDFYALPEKRCKHCDEDENRLKLLQEFQEQTYSFALAGEEIPKGQNFALVRHEKDADPQVIVFEARALRGKLLIRKTYRVYNSERVFLLTVDIENLSMAPLELKGGYSLSTGAGIAYEKPICSIELTPSDRERLASNTSIVVGGSSKTGSVDVKEVAVRSLPRKDAKDYKPYTYYENGILWAGIEDMYFVCLVHPNKRDHIWGVEAERIEGGYNAQAVIKTLPITLAAREKATHDYSIYIGPKSLKALTWKSPEAAALVEDAQFDKLLGYRWLDPISKLLTKILDLGYFLFRNYGIAVIFLTAIVRFCMYPLSKKSQRAMFLQQQLQPQIEKIRERFKDDKQRQHTETMKLFKKYGVNPIGGCMLPLLIQFPIFIGLYRALQTSVALRQAPFVLWIQDLSQPDCLVCLPGRLPLLSGGECLNVFPLVFVVLMIVQQLMSPRPADPQQASMQRMMMIVFTVMMLMMFYSLPSGLYLYFLTSSAWGLVEQKIIRKKLEEQGLPEPIEPKDSQRGHKPR